MVKSKIWDLQQLQLIKNLRQKLEFDFIIYLGNLSFLNSVEIGENFTNDFMSTVPKKPHCSRIE